MPPGSPLEQVQQRLASLSLVRVEIDSLPDDVADSTHRHLWAPFKVEVTPAL
jgi:hypothetical protein